MSLLLDALKEAERRKSDPGPAAASRRDEPSVAPVDDDVHPDRSAEVLLSLAEEPATPKPAFAAAASVEPTPAKSLQSAASAPLATKVEARAGSAASLPAAAKSRGRLVRQALLAAIVLVCAAAFWILFRQPEMALTPLSPPMTAVLPAAMREASDANDAAAPPARALELQTARFKHAEPAAEEPRPAPAQSAAPEAVAAATASTSTSASEQGQPRASTPSALVIQGRPSPLTAAHAALRAGDLPRAEQLYRETLAGEPDHPDAHLGLALIEQSRNSPATALAHYRRALSQRPADAQAWAGLADLASDIELDAMESRLRNLLGARQDPALHFALGNLLVRQSRWPEAQESFFAAVAGAPGNADYVFNLAVALDRLGKPGAAATQYARALELASQVRGVQFDVTAVRARTAQLQAASP